MHKLISASVIALTLTLSVFSPIASAAEIQSGTVREAATAEARNKLAGAPTIDEAKWAMGDFLAQYNLTLKTSCGSRANYTCTDLSLGELGALKTIGTAFIDEWAKYPAAWVEHTKLESITLTKDLTMRDVTDDSAKRSATPSPEYRTMVYDVTYGEAYMREVFHHEFEHYISYMRYDGDYYHRDATWSSYNPNGFTYGKGGSSCYTEGVCNLSREHPSAGFVTGYAMSGQEEDRAEVYSFLFATGDYDKLMRWAAEDPSLAKKVAWYKNYIVSIVPSMNEAYFAGEIVSHEPLVRSSPLDRDRPIQPTASQSNKPMLRMIMWMLLAFAGILLFGLVVTIVIVLLLADHNKNRR